MSEQQDNLFSQLTNELSATGLSFDGIANNFHFIRPWWFLAFAALFLVIYLLKKIRYYQSPWQHFLPAHLAKALLENSQNKTATIASSQGRYWLKPLLIGSCVIFALAGPVWQKLPQPVYQLERGAVIIMDMSYSMYATDLKPNRLTRARYKATDLLKKINEGDIGLIAYAGDAFIISPLTQDDKNIELLLPSLSPDIMPVHGANALAALILADKTLKNSGHISGDIYWFTDDVDNTEMSDILDWANNNDHKLNILGVGTKSGAPIKLTSGKLLKDNKGAIVIPKLPEGRLAAITKRSRGVYRTMSNDDSDLKALTAHLTPSLDDELDSKNSQNSSNENKQLMKGDQYQEQGPWLLILILPLLLTYFRRGSNILAISWLMPLTLVFALSSVSPSSYAADSSVNSGASSGAKASASTNAPAKVESNSEESTSGASQFWRNLWQTSDQQGQQHYQQEDYQKAAQQFEDSQWQGSAHYKAGDYEQALQAFKQGNNAEALYNQGNSLAQLQKVDEAIDAYKQALEKDPSLSDAKDNLAKLEALKKQQEEQQQQQDSQEQSDGDQQEKEKGKGQDGQQNQDNKQKPQDESASDQQGQPEQSDPQENSQEQEPNEQEANPEDKQSQEEKQQEQSQAEESEQQAPNDEKSLAQQASDKKAQETQQKHQQLLNKVTDDPYLLLRNKMRLEYQKRRHENAPQGVTKKW